MQSKKRFIKFYQENNMKSKIGIFISITSLITSSFLWHSLYAQEFSPLGKLAQDYMLRLNGDVEATNSSNKTLDSTVVVNPDNVIRDAISESIDTISKTVEEMRAEEERVISKIKTSVKEDIDNSIIEIRKETKKPAYELQRSVDVERTQLFENITQTIESVRPTTGISEGEKLQKLQTQVDISLDKIQNDLKTESGQVVNFERSQRDVRETLLRFQKTINEKKEIIESRQGDLVFKDTDNDGISDYDELYIYKTDVNNPRTKGDTKTDGEKILEGINPLSDTEEMIKYQDPREDKDSFVSQSYRLGKLELLKEEKEKILFEGNGLPNTFITLFIYSTPIIVTVKTNEDGQWNYRLEKEIENGEHQIFVASVDTSGKIIARSNPILFTKTAEAATIGIVGSLDTSASTQNFMKDNFILITLAVLIMVVILGMMFVGNHKNIKSAIFDLHKEVTDSK